MVTDPIALKIKSVQARVQNVVLRMPFRFGFATLTRAPLLTLQVVAENSGGKPAIGYSSDLLIGMWFDKSQEKSIDEKVDDELEMIGDASELYIQLASDAVTPFELWLAAYRELQDAARKKGINALTAGFASSLLERATIDAACRIAETPFCEAMRNNRFGIAAEHVHEELAGFDLKSALPPQPLSEVWCRHTVGMADCFSAGEIPEQERLNDGLPQTLEDDIERYGHRYFKLKIGADREANFERLTAIAQVLNSKCGDGYRVTLDGNEQVESLEDLQWLFDRLAGEPGSRTFLNAILFIEQPLPRDRALKPAVKPSIVALDRTCPLIIDEADDSLDSFVRAREVGYRGISSKNCKGVFKSFLNHCLARKWNDESGAREGQRSAYFLSSEDLTNVGAISLQQDMATISCLGIAHSERNGHHYFRGLDHLRESERASVLEHHADLYEKLGDTVALKIRGGRIQIGSVHGVGYGHACDVDFESRPTIDQWRSDS